MRFLAPNRTDLVTKVANAGATMPPRLRWSLSMPVSVIPVAINLNQECRRGGTGRHGDLASLWTQVRVSGAAHGLRPRLLASQRISPPAPPHLLNGHSRAYIAVLAKSP